MSNSTNAQDLFEQWGGQVVPRSFNAGFVALSYVVSLIGAASTLELINRRTASKGVFNHLLLFGAAVTMGGIAIWCMHYIGNRAIDILNGEAELQIAYSSGFTAMSFFVPIAVLLTAFWAIGTNNKVSWWRVAIGGALAGAAICGMHYLGNASINNYACIYGVVNVVGAALIAVAASITALALFFVFRAAWTNSWWKRCLCSVVLAGAVSGMHWCASTGTQYRLVALNTASDQLSRNTTVIVVICLSVGACLVMAVTAIYTAHVMRRSASKAQKVVLAAAVFDRQGRVLVSPDGLLPSEKVTDSFADKAQDSFSVAHPLFQWMFQVSRNWSGITALLSGMTAHLTELAGTAGREGAQAKVRLVNEHGELAINHDIIFRELFCVAAAALADQMKVNLTKVGFLWDEILPTGTTFGSLATARRRQREPGPGEESADTEAVLGYSEEDLSEKGLQRQRAAVLSRGSLMFLVRRVETQRDTEALEAAGYRFAELHQVSGIIGSSMQITTGGVEDKLRNMAAYADESATLEPGVHLGFFAVRARVGTGGFDVLVRRGARNLLPSVLLPIEHLDEWQLDVLRRLDRMSSRAVIRKLDSEKNTTVSPREMLFASQLVEGIEALGARIGDPVFEDALLTPRVVQVPCRSAGTEAANKMATLITFQLVVPIHQNIRSASCELVPLSLFKTHQLARAGSSSQQAFTRAVHREMSPIINAVPLEKPASAHHRKPSSMRDTRMSRRLRRGSRRAATGGVDGYDADGNSIAAVLGRSSSPHGSNMSSSTLKLWKGERSSGDAEPSPSAYSADSAFETDVADGGERRPSPAPKPPPVFGGILVSQEITVKVQDARPASGQGEAQQAAQREGSGRAGRRQPPPLLTRRSNPETTATERDGDNGKPPAAAAGGDRTALNGKGNGGFIEMTSLSPRSAGRGARVHAGAAGLVSNVEAEQVVGAPRTFADELFAICLEGR